MPPPARPTLRPDPSKLGEIPSRQIYGVAALIVLAGLLAYHGIFTAPFIFDDMPTIVENLSIRRLWPLSDVLLTPPGGSGVSGRPLVNLSLALNYACGGLDVRGYHAANVAIHLVSGLLLFGIVRRTAARLSAHALPLAFSVALLWTVHPLLTESVTCVIQRTESMMGMFYLLTLYAFIRSSENLTVSATWASLSVSACFLGMTTKEVMVSAPLMILIYDRLFISSTFAAAWNRRRPYYLALAATWLVLVFLLVHQHGARGHAAGFGLGMSVGTYALTQCWAIVHYLQLAFWPRPLILDFGSDVILRPLDVAPQMLLLAALGAGTVVAWVRQRGAIFVFLSFWFFAILAPSSSVIPLPAQTVAEHRMYLPLAAVLTAVVVAGFALLGRRALWLFLASAVGLGGMTLARNRDYRDPIAMWSATVAQRPGNSRAQDNLGLALARAGSYRQAIACYQLALEIDPAFADAHRNYGDTLFVLRDFAGAAAHYREAVRLKPGVAEAHNNLGSALYSLGRYAESVGEFQTALRLRPVFPDAEKNLGNALRNTGDLAGAIAQFEHAVQRQAGDAAAENRLGFALREAGRLSEAIVHYRRAVRLDPNFAEAHNNLGAALGNQGHLAEAAEQFAAAVRLRPDYVEASRNLALAQAALARPAPP